ncbi:MAG TPA: tRNA (N6-threonylcarbamoyladenosine(37)-N6)-methyltransferase TrmO [Candidatus Acidoferrum sp.]|nr:tRNA (N6-threonylcarbamoyladenosine(37)-N6)-methyltransferase TrmO [Candidatus Acidoferrum sp.]
MSASVFRPIGVIHSPLKEGVGAPIQSVAARDVEGVVELFPQYAEGLRDIEGFSHIILIYHFHLSGKSSLIVRPYLDDETHGVFATRAPARPNPIGISVVRLARVDGTRLHVAGVDMLDGTPLLDIKPYIPQFDAIETERIGWLKDRIHMVEKTKGNGRFRS